MGAPGAGAEGGARPRLVAREMVLENFKSYAGEQRVGPFHRRFSAVVGPNGSGKSNVIDALLFVCGYRASKLRQKKVSQLIHRSKDCMDLPYAKVSVVFEEVIDHGDEDFEIVPGSEVTVTRVAFADDRSEYRIDGKKSNFKEVTGRLKGAGLDLDNNRFLILQGEVESIAQMPSKGRSENEQGLLEYLEDIIGTERFVAGIKEREVELEALNEERTGFVQRMKMVSQEKDALESQKAEAVACLAKERELLAWQSKAATLRRDGALTGLESLEQSKTELQAELAEEKEKVSGFSGALTEAEGRYAEKKKEMAVIQKELDSVQSEFQTFVRKDAKLREDLKHAKETGKKLSQKAGKEVSKREAMQAEVEALEEAAPGLERSVADNEAQLEAQREELDEMLGGLKGEQDAVLKQMEKVNLELAPWELQVQTVQGDVKVVTHELDLIRDRVRNGEQRLQDARDGAKRAKAAQESKTKKLQELQAHASKAEKKIAALEDDIQKAEADEEKYSTKARQIRSALGESKADLQGQKNRSRVVQALMAAAGANHLGGIYGRLGDLGAIDGKYDVAVSTACGPLDNIVVESTRDAQRAVEFLRQNDLGRATFLILDQQQALEEAMRTSAGAATPEGVPRLVDLVKVNEERFRVAFYYALRDTVVCDDLPQANRVAFNNGRRWRAVTLMGQLIETSGTMSGGGGKPRSGRMCLGSTAPKGAADGPGLDVKALEKELDKVNKSLMLARDTAKASKRALAEAQKALARIAKDIRNVKMEVDTEQQKAAELTKSLSQLEKAAKVGAEDSSRMGELEVALKVEQDKLDELNASTADLRKQLAQFEVQLEGIGGAPLQKLKASVKALEEAIEGQKAELSQNEVKMSANRKYLDKTAQGAEKAQAEIEAKKVEIAALKEELAGLTQQAEAVNSSVQEAEELLQTHGKELKKLDGEVKVQQKELQSMKTLEVELEAKLEELCLKMKDEKHKVKAWEKELAMHGRKVEEATTVLREALGDGEEVPGVHIGEEEVTLEACAENIALAEATLAELKPSAFQGAIEEYRKKAVEYSGRMAAPEEVTSRRNTVRDAYDALRKERLVEFMSGFNTIALKLKETYQMITLGGDAELILTDSMDPFAEGIEFQVRPPNKTWKNIRNLSGGEKTLSSLALVFALHYYKPNALYVMDEIDAALDFKNVSIVAHYIKERTKNAQFVIISLRNNMFELTDRLVGIYKTNDQTKSITINPHEFSVAAQAG